MNAVWLGQKSWFVWMGRPEGLVENAYLVEEQLQIVVSDCWEYFLRVRSCLLVSHPIYPDEFLPAVVSKNQPGVRLR